MVGTVDGAPFCAEINIAVAANGGVARPLIPRKGHETVVFMVLGGQLVQMFPEGVVDLEIVGLMRRHIQKRLIAGEIEVFSRCSYPDRFPALPMQVAPVAAVTAITNQQGPSFDQTGFTIVHGDAQVPGVAYPEIFQSDRTLPQRSEEHTSELQSLMRISYAVFCLKTK